MQLVVVMMRRVLVVSLALLLPLSLGVLLLLLLGLLLDLQQHLAVVDLEGQRRDEVLVEVL